MIGKVLLVQDPANPLHRILVRAITSSRDIGTAVIVVDDHRPADAAMRMISASRDGGTAQIVVIDDNTTSDSTYTDGTGFESLANFASTMNFTRDFCKEEPLPEPFINGNLRYLYRPPKQIKRLPVRNNHRLPLRQPCWRAGRWKSLT